MAINIASTTKNFSNSNGRHLLKTSDGKLLVFYIDGAGLKVLYHVSTDDGVTFGSSIIAYNTAASVTGIDYFSVTIDSSNNIHMVIDLLQFNDRVYYMKMTYSAGTWTAQTPVLLDAGAAAATRPTIALQANGDIWYSAANGRTRRSQNGGSTFSDMGIVGASQTVNVLVPVGSDMWLIQQEGTNLRYYVYTSSWSSSTTIGSSLTSSAEGLSVAKNSDTDIWVSARTSSGIKVFHYTGTWDTGEVVTTQSTDINPGLGILAGKPIIVWQATDSSTSVKDIAYRKHDGAAWLTQVNLTNDATQDHYPQILEEDGDGNVHIKYQRNNSSPFDVWVESIAGTTSIVFDENITVTDTLSVDKRTLDLDENITITDTLNVQLTSPRFFENITVTDTLDVDKRTLDFDDNISITDSLIVTEIIQANFATKIISINPLIFVTNSLPAKLVEVDTTDPENPLHTVYNLVGASSARDVAYNENTGFIYIACANGIVVKVELADLNNQEIIDVNDADALLKTAVFKDMGVFAVSTENSTGEVYVVDEREQFVGNTDISVLSHLRFTGDTNFNSILGFVGNTSLEVLGITSFIGDCDFKCLPTSEVDPIRVSDFIIYINNVALPDTDVDLSSIELVHSIDANSTLTFTLTRSHDRLDTTLEGVSSQITNQNTVKLTIKGVQEFEGKISTIDGVYDNGEEFVRVAAEQVAPLHSFNKVTMPLPGLNKVLGLYDVLTETPRIYNPYVDPNDESPVRFKGIRMPYGIMKTQNQQRLRVFDSLGNTAKGIQDGSFKPRQNWTYFWSPTVAKPSFTFNSITATQSIAEKDPSNPFHKSTFSMPVFSLSEASFPNSLATGTSTMIQFSYVGTSLNPLSEGIWALKHTAHWMQRLREDSERDLGFYEVGEAPFQDISSRNGVFIPKFRWFDAENGLYSIAAEGYDYREYVKKVAELEYQKLLNINGEILPETSCDMVLAVDAYYFYNLKLLTRINIDNTTQVNIFNKNNGFPLSIKQIVITSNDLKVRLRTDNLKSNIELEEINGLFPDEDDYIIPEQRILVALKSDMNTLQKVE